MKYKGYSVIVELNEDSSGFFGRVVGLREVSSFRGTSFAEITKAFHDSVDDYLEFCAERGESPEKPYSGHFVLRVAPNLHRELAHAAEAMNTSLNALVESTLRSLFSPSTDAEIHKYLNVRQIFRAGAYKALLASRLKEEASIHSNILDVIERLEGNYPSIPRRRRRRRHGVQAA